MPTYGRYAFNRAACSLFLTVLSQTFVPVAFLSKRPNFGLNRNLLRRDEVVRKRSFRGVVLSGLPDLGPSATFPVCCNLFSCRLLADSWRWKRRATSLAGMPAVSIPMALLRCSYVIPGRREMTFDIAFQRSFVPVFVLTIRKPSNCVLCDPRGIIRFAVHALYMIVINVKIYDYIMATCTKTSEITQSMDGHNCSIRKRFSDLIIRRKSKT